MYDEIANLYHLTYEDWDAAIEHQAAALDQVFRRLVGVAPLEVLDVSCGIGTQALGLAARSHKLSASDLSVAAVNRARREAELRGLKIKFAVADMRDCADVHGGGFDVVLSAGNSIPHLVEAEVVKALAEFYESLRPGGLVAIGMRDYSVEDDSANSPQMLPFGFRQHGDDRYFVFQVRDWEGAEYDVTMYFVREARTGEPAHVTSGKSRYYPIEIDQMISLLRGVGFENIDRIDDAIYKPLVVGRRRRE